MIRLNICGHNGKSVLLEPQTGHFSLVATETTAGSLQWKTQGVASIEPLWGAFPRLYAIYTHQGRLYFQSGHRHWDVSNGAARVKFWWLLGGLASGLIIEFKTGEIYRPVLIHPGRMLRSVFDPTYDLLDAESDHFFLYLRQIMADPDQCQHLLKHWGTGAAEKETVI